MALRRGWRLLIAGILLALVSACATVPETERRQLLLLSPAAEVDLGLAAFDQVREDLEFVEEGPGVDMVRRTGERIVAVAQPMLEARGFGELEWEFLVADSEMLNAFVLPGGKVVFYQGMVEFLEDEDSVAAVMGHEVAHVVGRHGGERVSQNVLIQVGLIGAHIALASEEPGRREPVMAALGIGAVVGVQLPFSRAHEAEADEIGLTLMARAGYDPRAAVRVWERMDEQAETRPPEFLSTHPHPDRRAENLRALMPAALEEYRAARDGAR